MIDSQKRRLFNTMVRQLNSASNCSNWTTRHQAWPRISITNVSWNCSRQKHDC